MKKRRFWIRAIWWSCFFALLFPFIVPVPRPYSTFFVLAGLLLFVLGIIQVIRRELYKGERLKAIARGECPTCGYTLKGLPSTTCPECGEVVEAEHGR